MFFELCLSVCWIYSVVLVVCGCLVAWVFWLGCCDCSYWEESSMSRVLSTEQAKAAIGQVQSIITGGFTDQISALDAQGRVLSDPNVWDGPLAAEFRGSTWPETKAALDKAKEELEQLRGQLQKISQDIFSAGGGA
ncbi:hypothetical protein QEH68_04175 [Paenarthrobacter sp. OM7]|uniref:Pyrophosphorylase n=4 Tax=Paenarthrobacter TaxID=1742992 RepID=A0AB39YPW2_9MICC|nr:hypothetical protein [Paenarthrobacter sp. OM7]WGM21391.1 hypothetical protein QEH68_04175 [Paenarthrobacter sp. OM7]